MRRQNSAPLSKLTTLGLGGPATELVEVGDADETVAALRLAHGAQQPVLVLAGGSNVVISDAGFAGTVVLLRSRGARFTPLPAERVRVTVAAGHPFDELVAECVASGLAGLECLSGIPGSVGATPIQNVGAYGQEVAETITSVTVYDRQLDATRVLTPDECRFSYRHSVFKHNPRYIVLEATFELRRSQHGAHLRFGELTRRLGVEPGGSAPLAAIRETVLSLRRGKGMVIDADDPDSRSVGSFFTNPVLSAAQWRDLQATVQEQESPLPPAWPQPNGEFKLPAAWLIENAGFTKGYGRDGVAISSKHTLALTNRGGGSTAALLALAREIQAGVAAAFGVRLVNEPVLIGESL